MLRTRFTSSDLELLPQLEGVRYEIIDGELYVSTQPSLPHQFVCTRLSGTLDHWNMQTGLGLAFQAPGVIFADDNNVAPDIVWVSWERLPGLRGPSSHLYAAPELVIEVLSPGRANQIRDRELKLDLYDRRGVDEYWIVDWECGRIELYRRENGDLRLVGALVEGDILTSPLLAGFACPVSSLFPPNSLR